MAAPTILAVSRSPSPNFNSVPKRSKKRTLVSPGSASCSKPKLPVRLCPNTSSEIFDPTARMLAAPPVISMPRISSPDEWPISCPASLGGPSKRKSVPAGPRCPATTPTASGSNPSLVSVSSEPASLAIRVIYRTSVIVTEAPEISTASERSNPARKLSVSCSSSPNIRGTGSLEGAIA